MRLPIALALLSCARAQIAVSLLEGTVETPVTTTLDYGRVAQGDAKDLRVRLRGTSTTTVLITGTAITGSEFSVTDRPSFPISINATQPIDITVRFRSGAPASYAGILRINHSGVLNTTTLVTTLTLLAISVPAPSLNSVMGCTLASAALPQAGLLDFGRLNLAESRTCQLSFRNPSAQALTLSTISVSGNGFELAGSPGPLTVPANSSADFGVVFRSATSGIFSGALTVDTRRYALAAIAVEPRMPAPIFEFDPPAPESAQQVRLSIRLASPAPSSASGFVNLTFEPNAPGQPGDSSIFFVANSARTVPFSVRAGETEATLGGLPFATFQTGTTAGRIAFALSSVAQGVAGENLAALAILPSPVAIASTVQVMTTGLSIQITGFDNTYSAGPMGFTFRDRSSNVIGNAIRADFTQEFKAFYAGNANGSAFRLQLRFPVNGDQTQIGSVDIDMLNSTGKTTSQTLRFP